MTLREWAIILLALPGIILILWGLGVWAQLVEWLHMERRYRRYCRRK